MLISITETALWAGKEDCRETPKLAVFTGHIHVHLGFNYFTIEMIKAEKQTERKEERNGTSQENDCGG